MKYALALLIALFALQLQAKAQDDVPKFIRIPVFYVSDRNRVDSGKDSKKVEFGSQRQYEGQHCMHDPHIGVAWCVIKNTEKKPECVSWKALGWEISNAFTEGGDGTIVPLRKDYEDSKTNFYDKVYDKTMLHPDKELYVFVPGYMSTFESGLRSAARLAYFAEKPMMLYSWPSKGKFTEYFADEATVEWSQEHFDDVLKNIGKLNERKDPMFCRLYAHSMGGRLVLRATPVLKGTNAVREVSVVCPDIDEGVVKHYANKYFDGKQQVIVRLYESKRDEMLRFSQLVHGGYKRFGEDRTPLDTLLPGSGTKSSLPSEAISEASTTDSQEDCAMTKMLKRMQTIDFTDIDVGTLGHRIPVEVLASLSEHGCPGKNLKMCMARPVKKFSVSTLSAAASSTEGGTTTPLAQATSSSTKTSSEKAELPNNMQAADSPDGVIKIEHTKRWPTVPVFGTFIKYRPRIRLLLTKDWSLR